MKKINLRNGHVALIDNVDLCRVSKFTWFERNGYVMSYIKNIYYKPELNNHPNRIQHLSKFILNASPNSIVDHKNRNRLDNRRKNLRIATRSQNQWNRSLQKNSTSGFKGVTWHKKDRKWHARIGINNQRIHLGGFKSKKEAFEAYKSAAAHLHGSFACT